MAVDTTVQVVMPAMGDSVSEGTILEWHKQEGDHVSEDETIVEISTDKVDAEVPAPASGVMEEILAQPGDTVTVGQVIGRMKSGANGATAAAPPPEAPVRRAEPEEQQEEVLPDGVRVATDPATGDVHAVVGPHYRGVQFHAESILTENGYALLRDLVLDLLTP
jgi:2-oxoglutarate dehydrogenase E1 component